MGVEAHPAQAECGSQDPVLVVRTAYPETLTFSYADIQKMVDGDTKYGKETTVWRLERYGPLRRRTVLRLYQMVKDTILSGDSIDAEDNCITVEPNNLEGRTEDS